jgi:catechol 2,3-dioxygenase-like lactoylglutathione lyase family enzyme
LNVKQSVPFFMVSDMQASLRFYVDGLGFTKTGEWVPRDRIEWCWLQYDGAALMLQEYREGFRPEGTLGLGVSVCFICDDALAIYRQTKARGLRVTTPPFVGNNSWVVEFTDPDGYAVLFESATDVPEETVLEE